MISTGRRVAAVALLVLSSQLLAGCASAPVREPASADQRSWSYGRVPGTRIDTAHYEIFTTIQEPNIVAALPDVAEAAYSHYQTMIGPRQPPAERMKIYVFANRDQWANFTRRFTGPRASTFLQVRNGGYTENGIAVMQYINHSLTFPILTHEGFHLYLHHCVDDTVPAWLNEGVATLCEGQRWDGWRLARFDPLYNPSRQNDLCEALVSNKLIPLRTLIQTHAGLIVKGPSRGVVTYYGQVWALMIFLRDGAGGRYRPALDRLLHDLGRVDLEKKARAAHISSSRTEFNFGEALFCSYFGDDLDTIEAEYLAFMRSRFLGSEVR